MAPAAARLKAEIDIPIEPNDPSEAIRSSEIPRFLADFFDILVWRPYGGQVVDLVFPCLDAEWVFSPEGLPFVAAMLRIEDYELARNPAATHYVVAHGRLKGLPRLARPLARQVAPRRRPPPRRPGPARGPCATSPSAARFPGGSGGAGTRCARTGRSGRARTRRSTSARPRRNRRRRSPPRARRTWPSRLSTACRVAGLERARDRVRHRAAREAAVERVRRAVGVDLSEEMIRRGREYCADRPNVELHRTDGVLGFLDAGELRLRVLAHRLPARSPQGLRRALPPGSPPAAQARRHPPGAGRRPRPPVLPAGRRGLLVGRRLLGARAGAAPRARGLRVTEVRGAGTQYLRATAVKPSPRSPSPRETP